MLVGEENCSGKKHMLLVHPVTHDHVVTASSYLSPSLLKPLSCPDLYFALHHAKKCAYRLLKKKQQKTARLKASSTPQSKSDSHALEED